MIMLWKSSGVLSPVSVRSVNSRCSDSIRPAGNSTFSLRSADSMSCTVTPRAAMDSRSSHMRMACRRAPFTRTVATPSMTDSRSTIVRSERSVSSIAERVSLDTSTYIVASMPESCLVICGGSASSGSERRMRETRSRTSFAAASVLRSRLNSIVIDERSS